MNIIGWVIVAVVVLVVFCIWPEVGLFLVGLLLLGVCIDGEIGVHGGSAPEQVTIRAITWNSENSVDKNFPLESWDELLENPPDVFVVLVQEFDHYSAGKKRFLDYIQRKLGSEYQMHDENNKWRSLFALKRAGGIFTFYRKELHPQIVSSYVCLPQDKFIKELTCSKASIGTVLKISGRKIMFVSSHFPFKVKDPFGDKEKNRAYKYTVEKFINKYKPDAVIWGGDFNYRICGETNDPNDVCEDALMEGDQLDVKRNTHEIFLGFSEGPLVFPPTCKFKADDTCRLDPTRDDCYVGKKKWDSQEEEWRPKGWCDRLFYKDVHLIPETYRSYEKGSITSDHNAVVADYIWSL